MTLFTKGSATPLGLPFADRDAAGDTWTDLANNPAGRAACGWEPAPTPPAFDPGASALEWRDGAWALVPRDVPPAVVDIEAARSVRLAAVAGVRWDRQQTMTWRGNLVGADMDSQGNVTSAILAAQIAGDASFAVRWKFGTGWFETLTMADLIDYGLAMRDHKQACFDREEWLSAEILAATDLAQLAAVDLDAGWPA